MKLTGSPQETGEKSTVRYSATDGSKTKVGTMSAQKESGLLVPVQRQGGRLVSPRRR